MENSKLVNKMLTWLQECDGDVQFFGNTSIHDATIVEYLANIRDFECPDSYSLINNSICIIEHFEFDSTVANRKGSKSRTELSKINSSFKKLKATEKGIVNHDILDVQYSAKNYIDNALQNFDNHYLKIDSYIQNLRNYKILNNDTKIAIGFFIEDATILGNLCIPEDWQPPKPLILVHCKQFLDKFEECSKLDFCFCASSYGQHSCLWFINKEFISEYRKHQIDVDKIKIADLSPRVMEFKKIIPNEPL